MSNQTIVETVQPLLRPGLVPTEIDGDLLILDTTSNDVIRVSCGDATVDTIVAVLDTHGLLATSNHHLSRRQVLAGGAAAGAAAITVMALPTATAAASPAPVTTSTTVPGPDPNLGAIWTAVPAAEASNWRWVAYGNGVFVAVANDGTNRVMRSEDDGQSWTAVPAAGASNWLSVAYGNGVWIAVASDGTNRVLRSEDDGVTWTAVAATEANSWWSVAYGNNRFVAVASDGTNRVMYSPSPAP
jgi:hypothetical protein